MAGRKLNSHELGLEPPLPHQIKLLDQVKKGLAEIERGGNSVGILNSGPSGTGKTHGLDLVANLHLPYMDGVQRCLPCCRVAAGSRGDMVSVCRSILAHLGKPLSVTARLKPTDLEAQVMQALNACRVMILILEELNNALLLNSRQLRGQLARFLKNQWNLHPADNSSSWANSGGDQISRRIIIVSGTPDIEAVFERDDELDSRFSCRVPTMRLWFDNAASVPHFRHVLASLCKRFGVDEYKEINQPEFVARCLFASEGHLRRTEKLVSRVATLRRKQPDEPALAVFSSAFGEVGQRGQEDQDPFFWTSDELSRRVKAAMAPMPKVKKQKAMSRELY